jgi:hypothetical protein
MIGSRKNCACGLSMVCWGVDAVMAMAPILSLENNDNEEQGQRRIGTIWTSGM